MLVSHNPCLFRNIAYHRINSITTTRKREILKAAMAMDNEGDNKSHNKKFKILALHGKGSSSKEIEKALMPLYDNNYNNSNLLKNNIEIDYLDAPHENGQWWLLPPGKRSFTADTYIGFEESDKLVTSISSDYDMLFGHSQGAILLVALLSLGKIKPKTMVLNGVAWPNPYTNELENLKLHNDKMKILFITGRKDKINPPNTQERVKESLMEAGINNISTIYHNNGHSVPMINDDGARDDVIDWIVTNLL